MTTGLFLFFLIHNLLHRAHRQTMADTLYLLIITNRKDEVKEKKEKDEEKTQGNEEKYQKRRNIGETYSCIFTL